MVALSFLIDTYLSHYEIDYDHSRNQGEYEIDCDHSRNQGEYRVKHAVFPFLLVWVPGPTAICFLPLEETTIFHPPIALEVGKSCFHHLVNDILIHCP